MNNGEEHNQMQDKSSVETKESSYATKAGKGVSYLLFLALWFFIGGFFSVGPRIAHNIDKAVGDFVLDGTLITWALLPVILLITMSAPTKNTFVALGINVTCWLAFLAALYIRWHLAYP